MKYIVSAAGLAGVFEHAKGWGNSPTQIEWLGGDSFLVLMQRDIIQKELKILGLAPTTRAMKEGTPDIGG